jgi:hypothetical protein
MLSGELEPGGLKHALNYGEIKHRHAPLPTSDGVQVFHIYGGLCS